MDVAVIGGGAAGFFAAICVKENYPDAYVVIFEKSRRVLAKVKVSGGGRCNLTNGNTAIAEVAQAYPRGGRFMKQALRVFSTKQTMEWFESRGIPLMTQSDNRVFPESQDSQTVVNYFLDEADRLGITVERGLGVESILPEREQLILNFQDYRSLSFDKVIAAPGGSPKREGLTWLKNLGHAIAEPVPSLFTFNVPLDPITELKGVAVEKTLVSIQGTKLKSTGPLLITHWGLSGPAVLKLSAFGARFLSEAFYEFKVLVNWAGEANNEVVLKGLELIVAENPNKILPNLRPCDLPDRLWRFLLKKCGLPLTKRWGELGKKGLNKLVSMLCNDLYTVSGKTGFKEEFVTCGGVSLESIDSKTMQSKACKNLYFAGEIMDIDGITGGFNFQAAWTTAFISGKLK